MRWRGLVLLVLALSARDVPAKTSLRLLARTGDLATDGATMTGLGGLTSARGEAVIGAVETAFVRVAGDAAEVLVRAGDPLPAPLAGRFATLGGAAIAEDGAVVFSATLDSPDATSGLFVRDSAGARTLVLNVLNVGGNAALATNAGGDVALLGSARVALWRPGVGTVVTIARRGRPLGSAGDRVVSFVGQPALSDDGAVAFLAVTRGPGRRLRVFRWRPDDSVELVAESPRRVSGSERSRAGVATNQRGDVAHVLGLGSDAALVVHPADGAPPYRVAAPGDVAGGATLTALSGALLAIDDTRRVAFLGDFGEARHVVLADAAGLRLLTGDLGDAAIAGATRLSAAENVAWTSGGTLSRDDTVTAPLLGRQIDRPLGPGFSATGPPSLNGRGDVVVRMRRAGVYRLARRGWEPLAREGDPVAGAAPVASIEAQRGGAAGDVTVLATLEDGRRSLLLRRASGLVPVVSDGDPSPAGGTIVLDEMPPHDVRAGRVVLVLETDVSPGALYLARVKRTPRLSVLGAGTSSALSAPDAPVALRDGVALFAVPVGAEDAAGGVFLLRGRRVVPIVVSGRRLPGAGGARVTDVGPPAGAGAGIVFEVGLDHPIDPRAFFSWTPGRGVRRFDRLEAAPIQVEIDRFVAARRFVGGVGWRADGITRLFLIGRHGSRVLASAGDESPLGRPLELSAPELAPTRRGVAFTEGAALLEARIPR